MHEPFVTVLSASPSQTHSAFCSVTTPRGASQSPSDCLKCSLLHIASQGSYREASRLQCCTGSDFFSEIHCRPTLISRDCLLRPAPAVLPPVLFPNEPVTVRCQNSSVCLAWSSACVAVLA